MNKFPLNIHQIKIVDSIKKSLKYDLLNNKYSILHFVFLCVCVVVVV